VAPGHGEVFDKAGVTATREYFEYLRDEVSAGMAAGLSLEERKNDLRLEKYARWANYERLRPNNIEAAYLNLKLYR
jgi:hypothetical protein